ncbi:hypothetical protein LX36DRAFT_705129 [Colletotrichum falcatum]|nr:hypothetical protein LX36DRAFT_705129 [Colletotrichum falcatum]
MTPDDWASVADLPMFRAVCAVNGLSLKETQFTDISQLRVHIESDHRCQCPCDICLGVLPGICQEKRSEFVCRCGFGNRVTKQWNEHHRIRRQVQCCCGEILCEKRARGHVKGCRLGSKKYVCWRPRTGAHVASHRLEFTNREDFLTHFLDECKGGRAGRPRKEMARTR